MNQRSALILGSGFAGWCVASASSFMLSYFRPSRMGDLDLLKAQFFFVLPALCGVAISAIWCSRKPQHFSRLDNVGLAGRISLLSYPIFGLIMGASSMIQSFFHGGNSSFSASELVMVSATLGAVFASAGLVVTGLPAFIAEYFVVHFVRTRWSSAGFSGVVP